MTAPTPPANGDTVALRGVVSTDLLRKGEVKSFIWSAFYSTYVTRGYAEIYTGGGEVLAASIYVKSINGTKPDPAGNVTVAGGGVTNPAVAAIVSASGVTRDAVDARAKTVGDQNYAPLFIPNHAYVAGALAVSPSGQTGTAKVNFTSGASYNAADWNLATGSGGGSSGIAPDPVDATVLVFTAGSGGNVNPDPSDSDVLVLA